MSERWVEQTVHEAYAAHTILCNLGFEPADIQIGILKVLNANPPGPHICVKLEKEGRRFVLHLRPAPRRDQKLFVKAMRAFVAAKPTMAREELDRVLYGSQIYKQRLDLLQGLVAKGFELRPGGDGQLTAVGVVREITGRNPGPNGMLAAVLLFRPDAHPVWFNYVVSLVHLRHVEGLPPAKLSHTDSSHEIGIVALTPDSKPEPADVATLVPLHPMNLAYQLRGKTDAAAMDLFRAFTRALAAGELSPDTDWRCSQIEWLQRWENAG